MLAVLLALMLAALAGCGAGGLNHGAGQSDKAGSSSGAGDSRLCVVTTIFPYYDFVRQIAGDRVKLKLIVPAGMDSHSFEPTPADMIAMQEADVLVCNGGEMERWVTQVLDSLDTSHMKVLTMMDYVDVVEEEHVEGMEDFGHDHDHQSEVHGYGPETHDHESELHDHEPETYAGGVRSLVPQLSFDADDGHNMDIEYDEHIWTSPVNAQAIVKIISAALSELSPDNAARFESSTAAYIDELGALDASFRQVVSQARLRMFVVADKFPFRYFADEYGLTYRAAFSGCSGDTEPSAKTIAYLIDRVRENDIPAVYYLELSSHRTAEIIAEETGAGPLLLHSCHNVTRRQFDEGITYLQLMRQNVENLRLGLQ